MDGQQQRRVRPRQVNKNECGKRHNWGEEILWGDRERYRKEAKHQLETGEGMEKRTPIWRPIEGKSQWEMESQGNWSKVSVNNGFEKKEVGKGSDVGNETDTETLKKSQRPKFLKKLWQGSAKPRGLSRKRERGRKKSEGGNCGRQKRRTVRRKRALKKEAHAATVQRGYRLYRSKKERHMIVKKEIGERAGKTGGTQVVKSTKVRKSESDGGVREYSKNIEGNNVSNTWIQKGVEPQRRLGRPDRVIPIG